jgi:predicted metal-binding protein
MCQTYKAIEIVRTHDNGLKDIIIEVTCKRCSGNGVLPQYKHINNGRCFECEGTGVNEQIITINNNDKIELVSRTTEIKKIEPTNDNEALKNAMIRINNEHKERKEAIRKQFLEAQKLVEEMNNCTDRFTWDD